MEAVRQTSVCVQLTPTVDAVAYTSGDVVGGLQTISGLFNKLKSGVLKSIFVRDNANQKAKLTLLFFKSRPTGTYTNNAAFAWGSGDFALCIGRAEILDTDYTTVNSKATAHVEFARALFSSATPTDPAVESLDGYCVIVTTSTPTYAIGDLGVDIGFLRD